MEPFWTVASADGTLVATWNVEEAVTALVAANKTWVETMPDPETCSDDEVLKFFAERPGYLSNEGAESGDERIEEAGRAVLMALIPEPVALKFSERKRALDPPHPMLQMLEAMGLVGPHGPGCQCDVDWDEAAKPLLAAVPEPEEVVEAETVETPEKDDYGSDEAVEL